MNLIKYFIHRPVTLLAICIAILILGVTSYLQLPTSQYPHFSSHLIYVSTSYPGANPDTLQGFVTEPLESALANVDGVDYMSSSNLQGQSMIKLFLKYDTPIDKALAQVNSSVSSVLWRLPPDINTPQITKGRAGSPSIYLSVSSNTQSLASLTAYAEHVITPYLKRLSGISRIVVRGGAEYTMSIELDPLKLDAHNLTTKEVVDQLKSEHVQAPLGRLNSDHQHFPLSINSSLSIPEQFNNIIIQSHDHASLRLNEIGRAYIGHTQTDSNFLTNDKQSLFIMIYPKDNVNVIKKNQAIIDSIQKIKKQIPASIHVNVVWNPTRFTEQSLNEVSKTLWEAVALIILVILVFTGELKAILVPIVSIPLCLLGMAILMHVLGFSINTMTLLAAVLAIGLVVDDAIVVLENTHRYILRGEEPKRAAFDSIQEIIGAVVTMTLVVAIVFIPITLMSGIAGTLVRQFAITLSTMIILSGFVAIYISPPMCAYLIAARENQATKLINHYFEKLANTYIHILNSVLTLRFLVVVVIAVFCLLTYLLASHLPKDLVPNEEQRVAVVGGDAPPQNSSYYLLHTANKIKRLFNSFPEKKTFGIIIGDHAPYNNIGAFLILRNPNQGDRTEDQVIQALNEKIKHFSAMQLGAGSHNMLADVGDGQGPAFTFVLQTNSSFKQLSRVANRFVEQLKQNPNFINPVTSLHMNSPQFDLVVNRDRAASIGVSMRDITSAISNYFSRPRIGWFSLDGYSYPVIPFATPSHQHSPIDLSAIDFRANDGELVSLSNVATFHESVGSAELTNFQGLHAAFITANLASGFTIGQAVNAAVELADQTLPSTVTYDYAGQTRSFIQTNQLMPYIFGGCILAIYFLLVINFNSFIDPFIVLTGAPLSMLGALVAIYFSGYTLNIYTQVGLMMLIGLISKHGIMIVSFANEQQAAGKSIHDAILAAAHIRLKPILMTTVAMVFGAIPLLFAQGVGHISLQQIGAVIVYGLSFGSLMTLFVVPTIYFLIAKRVSV